MKNLFILSLLLNTAIFSQTQNSINIGDEAPIFQGLNQDSTLIYSDSLLKEGSLVLIFYRGSWCPYCQRHLSDLQDSLNLIRERGANIVVVTPEQPASYRKMIKKTSATYSILYDEDYKIMNAYEVSYKISKETVPKYFPFVKKLTKKANGNDEGILPIPATYIINKEGKVVYKYYNEDYTKRSTIKEILTYL